MTNTKSRIPTETNNLFFEPIFADALFQIFKNKIPLENVCFSDVYVYIIAETLFIFMINYSPSFTSNIIQSFTIIKIIKYDCQNPFFRSLTRIFLVLLTQLIFADGSNQPKDATNHNEGEVHRNLDGCKTSFPCNYLNAKSTGEDKNRFHNFWLLG